MIRSLELSFLVLTLAACTCGESPSPSPDAGERRLAVTSTAPIRPAGRKIREIDMRGAKRIGRAEGTKILRSRGGLELSQMGKPGATIVKDCPAGGCEQVCEPGQGCHFDCAGGKCKQTCRGEASCTFGCPGGGCAQVCEEGSRCEWSCGKDCTTDCAKAKLCRPRS